MSHTNELQLIENQGWDARILVCRNGRLVDTFIVLTERFVVLVDTVINPQTAAQMLDFARPYLVNGRQLIIINTHADYDHSWGNQLFAGETAVHPAPIIGSHLSPAKFQQQEAITYLAKMQELEPEVFSEVVFTPPTMLIQDNFVIDGGDLTLELLPTPGHTDDHYSLFIPEIATLLAADAAELPYPMARTPDGLPQMRQSLAKLAALPAKTVLYCHAPVTAGRQLLLDNIAYFDAIEAACRAALARGLSPELSEDVDVLALVDCVWETAVPNTAPWQNIHDYYKTTGHAEQIRAMLHCLGQEKQA
ncbi:MAG: MBL fold metallo-hydrolase [Anaerolineales bacterium]|nr:MBL fold metallo-hydrolase [Anaerolineales bacterium]MCB8937915.1 MBL fold metallo-hydrolase [Ardenticatenaceae bacterium]